MKLEAKLGMSTGILISAMLLNTITAHNRVQQANQVWDDVIDTQVPLLRSIQVVATDLSLSVRALESALLFGIDPEVRKHFLLERSQRIVHANEAAGTFRNHLTTPTAPETEHFHQIEGNIARLAALEAQVERLHTQNSQESIAKAYDLMREEVIPLDAQLEGETYRMAAFERDATHARMVSLQQANRAIVITLWASAFVGSFAGGWISLLLTRRIVASIRLVAGRANAIAAGDLTGSPLPIRSDDEIGDLSHAMQEMQANLANIIGTAIETARALTGSADSMHSTGDHIHRRIDEQSQQTQQAATALQQMSTSIAEVSRHARSAADTARSAAQVAHEGGDVVKQMLASMSSIASAFNDTSSTVGLLGDDSKRISQIVTVIDDIARKTNLLALNAAIEAARAGEQGRGFAVVAGEVRRLAESTAQATSQISMMIRGVQDRTYTAIASLASGTVTVQQGVATTNLAGESLERIIGMAERVDRMIAQIAIAATQQSVTANESSASLHSIYTLSHENLCEMATTSAGIETLRTTAVALEEQVVRFQLRTTGESERTRSPLGPCPPLQHA